MRDGLVQADLPDAASGIGQTGEAFCIMKIISRKKEV